MQDNKNLFIAIGFTAALALSAYILFKPKTAPTNSEQSKSETVTTESWIAGLKKIVAVGVCAEPSYFSSCYTYADSNCADTMQGFALSCYENEKSDMPKILRLPKDGVYWGRRLSVCAVKKAEDQLISQKVKSDECKSIQTWMEKNPPPSMTKARFMFSVEMEMPTRFCAKGSPVRNCYQMSDDECSNIVAPLVSKCVENLDLEIPGDLKIPQETLFWSARIGRCVGEVLEKEYSEQKLKNCQN